MSWWHPQQWVRVRHVPSGLTVTVDAHRSNHRNKLTALAMLRGKLWSISRGGYFATVGKPVRSYTADDLERADITEMPRNPTRTLAAVAALLIFAGPFTIPPASAEKLTGQARVMDGDTLDIDGTRIRLHGTDAPEAAEWKRWITGLGARAAAVTD